MALPRRRGSRIALLALLVIGLAVLIYLIPPTPCLTSDCSKVPNSQVLIIDQLAVDNVNATFRKDVASIFNAAKVSYDLVNGTEITIDYYRALPSKGYKLILIRSHSGLLFPRDPKNPVYLFTGERYKNNVDIQWQLSGALTPCAVSKDTPAYFCISPLFVSSIMNGTFAKPLILLNGCDTLINTHLADAFLSRGALGFTGWNEYVTSAHMDSALDHFLGDFVTRNMTLAESVQDTMEKIGPDPSYRSDFTFYPESVGSVRFLNLLHNSTKPQSGTTVSPAMLISSGVSLPGSALLIGDGRLEFNVLCSLPKI